MRAAAAATVADLVRPSRPLVERHGGVPDTARKVGTGPSMHAACRRRIAALSAEPLPRCLHHGPRQDGLESILLPLPPLLHSRGRCR